MLASLIVTWLLALLSAGAPAPGGEPPRVAPPAPAAVSHEIAFWSARVERDRDDHISATKLGYACLKEARRTGDFRLYAEAERALTEALRRSPGHYAALLGLATARAARHRFQDAIDLARQATAQGKDPDADAVIGDAFLGLGDLKAADAAYAEVALRAPGFAADTRRANLLHARGKSRAAIELLRSALADAIARDLPADARSWCHVVIGATLFDLGDWDGAEPEYRAALALTPESYVAIEHLAELRSYQRRDREALALYDRAIALAAHPDFLEAVARTHETAGRTSEARRWYARAREGYLAAVKAGDPGYYRNLAMYYVDVERRPADAVMWAKRDLALRQDAHAWATLAWALLANGDAAGAREASAKATATEIEDAPLWFRAGLIEKAAGRPAQAAAALRRALAINPRFDRSEEARRLLRELEHSRPAAGSRQLERPARSEVDALEVGLRVAEETHVAIPAFDPDPAPHLERDPAAASRDELELLPLVVEAGDRGDFGVERLAVDGEVHLRIEPRRPEAAFEIRRELSHGGAAHPHAAEPVPRRHARFEPDRERRPELRRDGVAYRRLDRREAIPQVRSERVPEARHFPENLQPIADPPGADPAVDGVRLDAAGDARESLHVAALLRRRDGREHQEHRKN